MKIITVFELALVVLTTFFGATAIAKGMMKPPPEIGSENRIEALKTFVISALLCMITFVVERILM